MLLSNDLYKIEHDILNNKIHEWNAVNDVTPDDVKYGFIAGTVAFVETAISYIDVIKEQLIEEDIVE